jgi:hypothetical protein
MRKPQPREQKEKLLFIAEQEMSVAGSPVCEYTQPDGKAVKERSRLLVFIESHRWLN